MNYRHHFHAGNFADVVKHVLLLQLLRALQTKDKGLLYLDTHAGRGGYDLEVAAQGDSLARRPEHPDGVGRLWGRDDLPQPVADYLEAVRAWDRSNGNLSSEVRFYPGSPALVQGAVREQDRMMLIEAHAEEWQSLDLLMGVARRCTVQNIDGYTAVRACLPPPERRALVLIDPPYEASDEFSRVVGAVGEALRRLPAATVAVWYPLTERARVAAFYEELGQLLLPPAWTAELTIAGEDSALKMRGCGVLVLNPPWQLDQAVAPWLTWLGDVLAQAPGGEGVLHWVVPEN